MLVIDALVVDPQAKSAPIFEELGVLVGSFFCFAAGWPPT
jgi:hypothetical protein